MAVRFPTDEHMSKKRYRDDNVHGGIVYSTAPDWQPSIRQEEVDTLPPAQQRLRVQYTRAGRGGKEATIISGFVGKDEDIDALARMIKQTLGCGGSTRDGEILIQGNKKEQVIRLLRSKSYSDTK